MKDQEAKMQRAERDFKLMEETLEDARARFLGKTVVREQEKVEIPEW